LALSYPFTELAGVAGVTAEQLEALDHRARELRSERARKALRAAAARGATLGAPRKISEATRRRATELREAGKTYREIAATLTAEGHERGPGLTEWNLRHAQRLLSRQA
jgi:DNA invertase Pin-like site-specific DNA recombinase